jgi:hypothetical protein
MLDVLLVTVTAASLVLAAVMGVVLWRVLQLDRRRSDARVASLRAAASQMPAINDDAAGIREQPASCPPTDLTDAQASQVPPDMFTARESSRGVRLFVAVAIASVIFFAVAATGLMLASRSARAGAGTLSAPNTPHATVPLELLVLDHVADGSHLAIRGVVQSPANASTMRDIVAVAYLFDRNGGHLGVARAPVVETVLEPGAASRFEIPVPDAQDVGRYRVTSQMGLTPVPHVDRRTAPGAHASPASRVALVERSRDSGTPRPGGR